VRNRLSVLATSLVLLAPALAAAQAVALDSPLAAVGESQVRLPPLRLAERAGTPPLRLAAAIGTAYDKLDDLAEWNRSQGEPARIGFTRALPEEARVDFAAELPAGSTASGAAVAHAGGLLARTVAGELVWGVRVEVADAYRLRLHLTEVSLPPGTQIWVYGGDNELVHFGLDLLSERERSLWTPSVGGGVIHLEVRLPAGLDRYQAADAGFVVAEVAEIFRLDASGRPLAGVSAALPGVNVNCLVDAQCVGPATFDVIDAVQQSVAHLQFIDGSAAAICSGGLLNDTVPSTFVPLFQTANHCLSSQNVVNTLEAFWDFYTPSCGAQPPNLGTLPRSNGGRLLATGQSSDYTTTVR